jgi:preprotein translocase subunit SecY
MIRAFVNAFKVPDLRNKIFFTLFIIAVYRLGAWIPVPGVDLQALAQVEETGGFVDLMMLLSGGALGMMAVFALGIMPYITASIIFQLLAVVIPKVEQWKREGEQGRRKITQWTRYLTVLLALLQSSGITVMARQGQLFQGVNVMPDAGPAMIALIILTFTAGTTVIMWLGELITQRGVGNGMSLIIYVAIIAMVPSQAGALYATHGATAFGLVSILALAITIAIVFMEQGQRRIPVQYARRQIGRRSYGGQSTYIPLKINQAGVIPIIFAVSIMYLPTLGASAIAWEPLIQFNEQYLAQPGSPVYIALFAAMNIFFTYFYAAIVFNPVEVADNIKRYGGFIPGIRPGRQTAEYLDRVLNRLLLPGSIYLTTVAVIPFIALAVANIQAFPLGGIDLLIIVGVALNTMQQVESQLLQRDYEGFLT